MHIYLAILQNTKFSKATGLCPLQTLARGPAPWTLANTLHSQLLAPPR